MGCLLVSRWGGVGFLMWALVVPVSRELSVLEWGQQMYLHLSSFTQLEEARYTNPNIFTIEGRTGKNT